MRDVAEFLAGFVDRVRHMSPEMGLLRIALLAVCLLAVVIVRSWTGADVAGLLIWLAGLLVVATLLLPDSAAPGALLAVLGVWWLGGAPGAEAWQHVTVAAFLGAIHVIAAHTGSAPSHASFTPDGSFTMLVGAGAYVVVVALLALLVVAVTSAGSALGSVSMAIGAGLALAAAVTVGVLHASRQ